MVRMLIVTVLFMSAQIPATPIATPQTVDCGELDAFFAELDRLMFTEMADIAADPDWQDAMERTNKKIEATESGILALNVQDFEPMITLYEVPGDVLLDYPEDDIPPVAQGFHDAALRHWTVMPAMMRSIGGGGVMSALVFSDDLDIAAAKSMSAIDAMTTACPDVIGLQSTHATSASWDSYFSNTDDMLPSAEREVPRGFAYSLMMEPSIPTEEEPAATPVALSLPAA